MEFQIEGKVFQKFPFTVTQSGSDDPYGGEDLWQVQGDWDNYGYLHIPNNSPSSGVAFKIWLQSAEEKTMTGSAKIVGPDGQVVGTSPEAGYRVKTRWARHPFNFRTDQGMLRGSELTARPGSYTLQVTLDGNSRSYPFEVADSKIVRSGRQAFTAAAEDRIEGGRDAWWLKAK